MFYLFQVFGITSLIFVLLSILGFCLETLPNLRPVNVSLDVSLTKQCDGRNVTISHIMVPNQGLYVLDILSTTYFTLELVVRFIFSPSKKNFVLSGMNFIDLLALVPLYMQVLLSTEFFMFCYSNEGYIFEIMFILRIIRMFRIFHLVKHYQALQILVYAIKASLQELCMLLIFLLLGMLVFATMIYYAERPAEGDEEESLIPTIPFGFWWAMITMTTVGYGDAVPKKPLGYIVGTACAVSGVLMVALTIPIISNNFTLFYTHVRSQGSGDDDKQSIPVIDHEISINSDDEGTIYENGMLTPNGSLMLKKRRPPRRDECNEMLSSSTADVYTVSGKCSLSSNARHARSRQPKPVTDMSPKSDDADYFTANANAPEECV